MAVVNSKVEICNQALSACGASTIDSLTDDSQEARACNMHYTSALASVLRNHNWNFATKRVELTLSTETTPMFLSTFQLPDDLLKVNLIVNTQTPYRIMGRKLVTNASSIVLEYVAMEVDVSLYDALFIKAFAFELASRLIYKFNQSSNARQEMMDNAKKALRDARTADGQEGTQYNMLQDQWLDSRYASTIEGGIM